MEGGIKESSPLLCDIPADRHPSLEIGKILVILRGTKVERPIAQLVSALEWGSRGRGFDCPARKRNRLGISH